MHDAQLEIKEGLQYIEESEKAIEEIESIDNLTDRQKELLTLIFDSLGDIQSKLQNISEEYEELTEVLGEYYRYCGRI